jgi:PAS domain S-box-containing protein
VKREEKHGTRSKKAETKAGTKKLSSSKGGGFDHVKGKHEEMKNTGEISSRYEVGGEKPALGVSDPPCSKGTKKRSEGEINILIIDDDELIRRTLKLMLEKQGYETEAAATGQETLEKTKEKFFNLALLDIRLPDMEGIELLTPLKQMHPDMEVVMITGYASLETAVRALHEGASAYITKPLKTDELLPTAREVLEKQRLAVEKRRAEGALRESEERYRKLFEESNDAILIHQSGQIVNANEKAAKMLGYSKGQLLTMTIKNLHPQEGRAESSKRLDITRKRRSLVFETQWIRADGRVVDVEVSTRLIDDEGKIFMGIARDISKRKRMKEALQREKQEVQRLAEEREIVARLGRIISSSLEIDKVYELFAREVNKAISFDRIGINVFPETNAYAIAYVAGKDVLDRRPGDPVPLAGSLTEEVVRTRSTVLMQGSDIDELVSHIPRLLPLFQAGLRSFMAVPLVSKDQIVGVLHLQSAKPQAYTEAEVNLAESIGAQIAGAIDNAQLYAEHKRAEEALARQAQELARSNAELEQFAYVASHDLQEPLRKIQAFGDRLKATCNDALDERGRDYLQRMQNAAKRLRTLINDLLTFSRVTTRGEPFAPVNLVEVARDVVSDLEMRIERTGGRVEVGELPTIEADPTQKRQLLQNLIDNGLKFHRPEEPPVVKVNGKLLGDRCQITVQDNGIGFEEKYLDRIFTIFQRLHGRSEYEGTGVGLAVCRKIAERHGGNITAQSAPGHGTTFIITLPVKQSKDRREEMYNG